MAKLFIPWKLHHGLALQLTLPYSQDNSVIRQLSDELQFTMNSATFFTAFIVKTELFLEASTPSMADLFQKFQDFLNPYHITCVYLEKKLQYMVYFLFSQTPPSRQILTHAGSFLMEHFAEFGRYSMGPRRHCLRCFQGLSDLYICCHPSAEQLFLSGKYPAYF